MRAPNLLRGVRRRPYRDPYEGLPTDELDEPILPRWFVLLLLASVPVAVALFVVAFFGIGRGETPVADRRPPPGDGLTSDVGDIVVGDRGPVERDAACEAVAGYRVAGTEADRAQLGAGLDALCDAPSAVREAVAALGEARPVARFGAFEATGVDVTGDEAAGSGAAEGAVVYVNARYAQLPAEQIAPLVAYQAVLAQGDPAEAARVVEARRAELAACESVVDAPGRACEEAEELLALADPEAALRDAGFR